jgi:hypothetical protein
VKVYIPRLRALLLMLIAHQKKRNLQPSEVYLGFKWEAFLSFEKSRLFPAGSKIKPKLNKLFSPVFPLTKDWKRPIN